MSRDCEVNPLYLDSIECSFMRDCQTITDVLVTVRKVRQVGEHMISNPVIAKQIKELMMDVFTRIDESVAMVRQTCSKDEADAYSRAAGQVAGALVLDVLEPLYECNPELKPTDWDT